MGDFTFGKIRELFNKAFPEVTEIDRDRYGFLTPADILHGKGIPEEKAIRVRNYLTKADQLDLDGNPVTDDVIVYRDGSTVSMAIVEEGVTKPVFSIDFADPTDCYQTYPEDHYRLPIPERQCRPLRAAHPALATLQSAHLTPEYWITHGDEAALYTADRLPTINHQYIAQANAAIPPSSVPRLWDLAHLPRQMTYGEVLAPTIRLETYPFLRSDPTQPVVNATSTMYRDILQRLNIPGKIADFVDGPKKGVELQIDPAWRHAQIPLRYGWVITQSDLRAVPDVRTALYFVSDDDQWADTGLNANQPVAIIGEAKDPQSATWYQVITTRVVGWIRAADVAPTTPENVREYYEGNEDAYLTVTVPEVRLPSGHRLEMGTRLYLDSERPSNGHYRVQSPRRTPNGNSWTMETLHIDARQVGTDIGRSAFHKGPVPLSRANFLRLAFQYLGTPWAMANERRGSTWRFTNEGGTRRTQIDCSGIMVNVTTAMGLETLARNSGIQIQQGKTLWTKGAAGVPDLATALRGLGGKAVLIGMPGHVALYLGERDGQHWIFHSPGHMRTFPTNDHTNYLRIGDGQAMVTPITLSDLHEKFTAAVGL